MPDTSATDEVYKHHAPGLGLGFRQIMFLVAAILFFGAALDLLSAGQALLCFIAAAIVAGIMVANNPTSGMSIDSKKITLYSGKWRKSNKLDKIDHIRFVDWADGPGFEIHTVDRQHFTIPKKCYGKAAQLLDFFDSLDVEIQRTAYDATDDKNGATEVG